MKALAIKLKFNPSLCLYHKMSLNRNPSRPTLLSLSSTSHISSSINIRLFHCTSLLYANKRFTKLKQSNNNNNDIDTQNTKECSIDKEANELINNETVKVSRKKKMVETSESDIKLFIIHPTTERNDPNRPLASKYRLEEAVGLAEACGWKISHALSTILRNKNSNTYFGSGKIQELSILIHHHKANVVYVNTFLTPVQQSKLQQAWSNGGVNIKVLDRFAVILEIFSVRAKTKESKLQVELAYMEYQKNFLVGKHAIEYQGEHQRGGRGFCCWCWRITIRIG